MTIKKPKSITPEFVGAGGGGCYPRVHEFQLQEQIDYLFLEIKKLKYKLKEAIK